MRVNKFPLVSFSMTVIIMYINVIVQQQKYLLKLLFLILISFASLKITLRGEFKIN